jgi:hypothetical protein
MKLMEFMRGLEAHGLTPDTEVVIETRKKVGAGAITIVEAGVGAIPSQFAAGTADGVTSAFELRSYLDGSASKVKLVIKGGVYSAT